MCTVLLPPGVNPIAVNKYIKLKPIPVCLENIRPYEISGYRRGVVKAFAPEMLRVASEKSE